MPEGPELHLASKFVNLMSKGRIYKGAIVKSAVSRQPDVNFDHDEYTISAVSRGKEVKLSLHGLDDNKGKNRQLDILFQFGMSGKFEFYDATELKKHAHLNFFTKSEPRMVLSFVDYRRFGKWQVGADWSSDRGPCVLFEYQQFRKNVLDSLDNSAFNRPICECLLNQKFFNGIGNYLRAEILFRAKIAPFVSARSVLEPLVEEKDENKATKIKSEHPDILKLCHTVPQEVVNLGGTGYDPEGRDPDYSKFSQWLQCYYNPNMKNMADHNKRTIWYCGNPGPLAPKDIKTRGLKRSSKVAKEKTKKVKMEHSENADEGSTTSKTVKSAITRQTLKEAEYADKSKKSKKRAKTVKEEEVNGLDTSYLVKKSKMTANIKSELGNGVDPDEGKKVISKKEKDKMVYKKYQNRRVKETHSYLVNNNKIKEGTPKSLHQKIARAERAKRRSEAYNNS